MVMQHQLYDFPLIKENENAFGSNYKQSSLNNFNPLYILKLDKHPSVIVSSKYLK